jgi:hypothetical protein
MPLDDFGLMKKLSVCGKLEKSISYGFAKNEHHIILGENPRWHGIWRVERAQQYVVTLRQIHLSRRHGAQSATYGR